MNTARWMVNNVGGLFLQGYQHAEAGVPVPSDKDFKKAEGYPALYKGEAIIVDYFNQWFPGHPMLGERLARPLLKSYRAGRQYYFAGGRMTQ